MRRYTASVVGCGSGGKLSLDAYSAYDRFDLVAACDLKPEVLEGIRERYPSLRTFPLKGEARLRLSRLMLEGASTTKRQGWRFLAEGAWTAAARMRSMVERGSGSGRKRRMLRRPAMAARVSIHAWSPHCGCGSSCFASTGQACL